MGMISPEWEEPLEMLKAPLTRTTLFLHSEGDEVYEHTQQRNIASQLNELQPKMLLFLKNLKRISIHFYDEDDYEVSLAVLSVSYPDESNRVIVHKSETRNGDTENTLHRYHVTKTTACGLPINENRDCPQEEGSQTGASASVILAFPLSSDDVPIIEPQELFAFLPVRRVGFNVSLQRQTISERF